MKTLICGFEPFGGRNVNNAWEVAQKFCGTPDIDVIKLPVSFEKAHLKVLEALRKQHYDLVLILGETGFTKDYVRLERLAINFKDTTRPDNDGLTADEEEIIAGAPKAYFTSFPVKKIWALLKEKGYPVKVTNSTGTFVCNSIYYNMLHNFAVHNVSSTVLFLHLPASTEVVSLPEMTETIKALLKEYSS